MGFDASVISGVVKFIEPQFDLTKIQLGWSVSSLTLTATLAMLVSGRISDLLGRRTVLKYAAILFTLSAVGSALAPSFAFLVAARMLGGIGVGASLIIAPMFIAEISPPERRGQLVSFNQLNIVLGISVAFFTNYLIVRLGPSEAAWVQTLGIAENNWRWMLGLETLPAIFYFIALFSSGPTRKKQPRWNSGTSGRALRVFPKRRKYPSWNYLNLPSGWCLSSDWEWPYCNRSLASIRCSFMPP